jgi:hypothetical protein
MVRGEGQKRFSRESASVPCGARLRGKKCGWGGFEPGSGGRGPRATTNQVIWARTRQVAVWGIEMVKLGHIGRFLVVRPILNFFRNIARIKLLGYGDDIEAVW